jgi:hypothetical protein
LGENALGEKALGGVGERTSAVCTQLRGVAGCCAVSPTCRGAQLAFVVKLVMPWVYGELFARSVRLGPGWVGAPFVLAALLQVPPAFIRAMGRLRFAYVVRYRY